MPNDDYILRSDATRCKYTFKQGNGVEIEPIEAVPVSYLQNIPAADVVPVVRCRDCKYKPTAPEGITEGFQVEFPYEFDNPCPCQCGDGWYSQKPHDDFFCAYGKKEEGHE